MAVSIRFEFPIRIQQWITLVASAPVLVYWLPVASGQTPLMRPTQRDALSSCDSDNCFRLQRSSHRMGTYTDATQYAGSNGSSALSIACTRCHNIGIWIASGPNGRPCASSVCVSYSIGGHSAGTRTLCACEYLRVSGKVWFRKFICLFLMRPWSHSWYSLSVVPYFWISSDNADIGMGIRRCVWSDAPSGHPLRWNFYHILHIWTDDHLCGWHERAPACWPICWIACRRSDTDESVSNRRANEPFHGVATVLMWRISSGTVDTRIQHPVMYSLLRARFACVRRSHVFVWMPFGRYCTCWWERIKLNLALLSPASGMVVLWCTYAFSPSLPFSVSLVISISPVWPVQSGRRRFLLLRLYSHSLRGHSPGHCLLRTMVPLFYYQNPLVPLPFRRNIRVMRHLHWNYPRKKLIKTQSHYTIEMEPFVHHIPFFLSNFVDRVRIKRSLIATFSSKSSVSVAWSSLRTGHFCK